MKLLIFFIIGFLNLSEIITKTYYSKGHLSKDNIISVKDHENCVYLDTNEIGNSGEIKIKVTTYNSFFMENVMHYGGSNSIENSISLTNNKTFDSYTASQSFYYDFRTFYLEFSYYFYIPISSSQRYLYVSIPNHSMYATTAYTEIKVESGLSAGAIVGIVFAIIAVIIIAIIIVIFYRRKNLSSNSSQFQYNPPGSTYPNNYNPPAVQPICS